MVRILLVRHGQSEWNAEGRWQGQADIPLSDLGRRQAAAAATRLGAFDFIASSTLLRASETASIIAGAHGMGPVIPIPDLVERSAGEWSGLTREDIHREWPGYLENDRRPPGYEGDEDLSARMDAGLREVAGLIADGEGLVVAHGGLIYLLEDRAGSRRGRIGNLGALWVEVDADGTITVGDRVELIDEGELQSAQSSDIL